MKTSFYYLRTICIYYPSLKKLIKVGRSPKNFRMNIILIWYDTYMNDKIQSWL